MEPPFMGEGVRLHFIICGRGRDGEWGSPRSGFVQRYVRADTRKSEPLLHKSVARAAQLHSLDLTAMDTKLKEWLGWLKIIEGEVRDLVMVKRTFHEIQQLIKDNPALHQSNSFYDYLSRTYVSHVVIGVRRQIKCDKQSISMARMFKELIETPEVLTRSYYVGLYKGSVVENFADRDFNKFAAPMKPQHIDPSFVTAYRDRQGGRYMHQLR